ncbi:MAG: RNA 2',3'-cyclic phosphodiesterase [Chromatiaceae bacterium]|nr:MAG: RNA 2',3'-cyclic phosphodiesterase [Chromatiaceae bacterium]
MTDERLFFALWPAPALRDALVTARAALPGAPGRLNHPDDLHLTLVFIGAVADSNRDCILAAGAAVQANAFTLTLTELGDWSRGRGGSLRWCRPTRIPPALPALAQCIEQGLLRCGIAPEKRRYRPHVTLARKAPPLSRRPLPLPLTWPVHDFVLAASRSGRRPAYEILQRFALAVGAAGLC